MYDEIRWLLQPQNGNFLNNSIVIDKLNLNLNAKYINIIPIDEVVDYYIQFHEHNNNQHQDYIEIPERVTFIEFRLLEDHRIGISFYNNNEEDIHHEEF